MPAELPRRRLRTKTWVCLLLAVHAGLLVWGALCQSPTVDEPVHLASGLRRLQQGRFDLNRGNPPLVGTVAALPVLFAHPAVDWDSAPDSHAVGSDFIAANGSRSFWLITLGRLACIPFSLLAGIVCFRWACELYGPASGFLVLVLWCFSPNAIAYGQLISGDMAAAALGLAACYAFGKWLQAPSLPRSAMAGIALGLAELTKYVWVLLFALWPLTWIIWRLARRCTAPRRPWLRELGHGAIIGVVSIFVINLGYLDEHCFQPLGRFHVGQELLDHLAVAPAIARCASALPVPLPEDYVLGIDEIQRFREARPWSYFCGQFRPGGWWYFYPCALALKLPLGTIYLLVLACLVSFGKGYTRDRGTELLILLSIAAILCFVTCSGAVQTFRYVLPVLPLALLWASKAGQALGRGDKLVSLLVGACLSWSVLSGLWIYPHTLSYFNEVAGGPAEGHEWLAESDIDWGQDLFYLKAWLAGHPKAKPFHLAYFGRVDPRLAGIDYCLPPRLPAAGPLAREQTPLLGWCAVSVHLLRGFAWKVPDGKGGEKTVTSEYVSLLRSRPVAMAGYSIYIYKLPVEDARRAP